MSDGLEPSGTSSAVMFVGTSGMPYLRVWVNCYQAMDPAVPFGGYKMSGYGRESGLQQLEEYLNVKAVWIKTA